MDIVVEKNLFSKKKNARKLKNHILSISGGYPPSLPALRAPWPHPLLRGRISTRRGRRGRSGGLRRGRRTRPGGLHLRGRRPPGRGRGQGREAQAGGPDRAGM